MHSLPASPTQNFPEYVPNEQQYTIAALRSYASRDSISGIAVSIPAAFLLGTFGFLLSGKEAASISVGHQPGRLAYTADQVGATGGVSAGSYRAADSLDDGLERKVSGFYAKLLSAQEPIGESLVTILSAGLWDLYEE